MTKNYVPLFRICELESFNLNELLRWRKKVSVQQGDALPVTYFARNRTGIRLFRKHYDEVEGLFDDARQLSKALGSEIRIDHGLVVSVEFLTPIAEPHGQLVLPIAQRRLT